MKFEDFLKLIYEIVSIILNLLWHLAKFLYRLITGWRPEPAEPELNNHYQAALAPVKRVLSEDGDGYCLNGKYCTSAHTALQGGIAIGGSGYGKTSCVLQPTLYNMVDHSVIIHDSSQELAKNTLGFHYLHGFEIKVLNYDKPERSDGYNPISRVRSITDAQKVSDLLIKNSLGNDTGSGNFWNLQASAFLTMLILLVLKEQRPEVRNLTNTKHLLDSYSSGSLDNLVAKSGDRFILQEYKNFLSYDQKVISSIVATCRSALNLWNSPNIQLLTSFDSIDFKAFRKQKTSLYIQNSTLSLPFYSIITSLFFEQFFAELMEELPCEDDLNTYFLIDEFSSLYIPSIQLAVSNLRKFKANCFLVVQSEHQIKHTYGDNQATSILQNLYSRVYFPGQDMQTCQSISNRLGKREVEIEDEETGKKTKRIRELLTAQEVYELGQNRALVFVGTQAIYTNMYPFYENKRLKQFSQLPAPEITSKLPWQTVPLITL